MSPLMAASIAPVEYAVAVDRYLAEAELGAPSRRVYRVSLAGWAWPLVGRPRPEGASRRRALPPVVPLAVLDREDAAQILAEALAMRLEHAEVRTVNRELSALRTAIGWWRRRQWIAADPTAGLTGSIERPAPARPLTEAEVRALFRTPAGLREHAFWHLLHDSDASAETVLSLDAHAVDLRNGRARMAGRESPVESPVEWGAGTSELLDWLLAGRRHGPLFRTDRRAPAGTPAADLCPLSGRGRMSYRRAAEIFSEQTRQLDAGGRGWMLHQLRRSGGRA
jgi:site-specific recombinase XerD